MSMNIGPLHVRRSIYIEAPPTRVWDEFTSFERICGWLDHGHRVHKLEPRAGGAVDMSVEIDGEERHYGGRVIVYEPERVANLSPNTWNYFELDKVVVTPAAPDDGDAG